MSRLNDLLRQLEANDPSMAKELRQEYDALADRRAFGLNFERHTPESVELPGRPVRKGDKVHVLPERGTNPTKDHSRPWRVASVYTENERWADIEAMGASGEARSILVDDLVVVAEFRDPIYPGLVSTGRIERGGDKPFHTVINAENYHALQTLLFTHRGQVDCIYIDPPYNTGNEGWIYNDRYVAGDDHYKHSKWLAFMERRLLLAKELLKPTGVIIVAVGDDEHHRLRMLLDEVFGADQFLANLAWQGNGSNTARYGGAGLDYMVCYALNESSLAAAGIRWREEKSGLGEISAAAEQCLEQSVGDAEEATIAFKKWWRGLPKDSPWRASAAYEHIDDSGRVFRLGPPGSPEDRPNRCRVPLPHPVTGQPCPVPPNGWDCQEETLWRRLAEGKYWFGKDHTVLPKLKFYLDEVSTAVAEPSFRSDRRGSARYLDRMLGERRFPNPKDIGVLQRWFRMAAGPDAVFLDFFGGSGSTAEAVMQLNASDGGTRRCVLITNNEASSSDAKELRKHGRRPGDAEWQARGVYEFVTKPRLSTVISGMRPDGSKYSEGLGQNVEFFTLSYEAPLRVSSNREFTRIAPLLWMKAGSQGRRIDELRAGWDVVDTYGVLADLDKTEAFIKALAQREADGVQIRMVFIVTDEDRLFSSVCRALPGHIEAVRLYEAYLRNFEIEAGRSTQ